LDIIHYGYERLIGITRYKKDVSPIGLITIGFCCPKILKERLSVLLTPSISKIYRAFTLKETFSPVKAPSITASCSPFSPFLASKTHSLSFGVIVIVTWLNLSEKLVSDFNVSSRSLFKRWKVV
jgi:hypothetical protein